MRQFSLSTSQVFEATLNYDTAVPARNGCQNRWKRFDTYRIRVTLDPRTMSVVTVWKEEIE
jgi:hypothetical protein